MKTDEDKKHTQAYFNTPQVTPLEERVLRMRHGVATKRTDHLSDASCGHRELGSSLRAMEENVLKRAPPPEPRAPTLRLVHGDDDDV